MAYESDDMGRSLSIGRVFSRAVTVIRANPAGTLGMTFLIAVLPGLLLNIAIYQTAPTFAARPNGAFTPIVGGMGLLTMLLAMWVQAGLVHVTMAGTRAMTMGTALTLGLRGVIPLLILSILAWIGISIGLMLFLVPGVILATMWAVAPGALVHGRAGLFGAFGRSRALTKGARWKILGFELVIVILFWGVLLLTGVGMVAFGTTTSVPGAVFTSVTGVGALIANAVISTLTQAGWGTAQAALYAELLIWKDGPESAHLAEVFA